ncbi:MAG TPA: hypothetical protein VNV87_14125, partial [Acidimicrobiales bacterium]|nr:hypothetical protein [Acidimicrobiales bacterium]
IFTDHGGRHAERGDCEDWMPVAPEPRKAVVLIVSPEIAEDVANLIAGTLSINGYKHNNPSVIDWPVG